MTDSNTPSRSHSAHSSLSLTSTLLDEHDEDVQMAVRALGAMRNGSGRESTPSSPVQDTSNPGFVGRMSGLPLLTSALRVYEQGKASSRVVKYGAEMMESSVKTISRPVIQRLPVNVGQLDEFACRQLDRIDAYRRPSQPQDQGVETSKLYDDGEQPRDISKWIETNSAYDGIYMNSRQSRTLPQIATASTSASTSAATSPIDTRSRSSTPVPHHHHAHPSSPTAASKRRRIEREAVHHPYSSKAHSKHRSHDSSRQHSRHSSFDRAQTLSTMSPFPTNDSTVDHSTAVAAPRSRWHTVLSEAGGLSAALSEESMRRLKFCLSWLMYATEHIDKQIVRLRDFTQSVKQNISGSANTSQTPTTPTGTSLAAQQGNGTTTVDPPTITPAQAATLNALRSDIVNTVRQVVDIVSKYAGGGGPGGLADGERQRVKGFILRLPGRFQEAMAGGEAPSAPGSAPAPPGAPPSATTALLAAQRVLALATESLDMMRGVTGVVKNSLDRADTWVDRLGTVGVGSGRSSSQIELGSAYQLPPDSGSASTSDLPVDAPSPGVGNILGRMSLGDDEVQVKVEQMEVDP